MDYITNYYQNLIEEDGRLFKDNKHKTEFILTTDYIDKYLQKGMRILELGAGTGAYSLYYAKQGYQVDALEPVEKNLNILKSKIEKGMNINPVLGNALDLSIYEKDTFDMVLCLGPMYHLDGEKRDILGEIYALADEALGICIGDVVARGLQGALCGEQCRESVAYRSTHVMSPGRGVDVRRAFIEVSAVLRRPLGWSPPSRGSGWR